MTLSEALDRYLAFAPDLGRATAKRMRYDVNRWLRLGGPADVEAIDKASIVAFRLAAKLSPYSVEGTIDAVLLLLKHLRDDGENVIVPFAGRRLRRRKRLRYVPPLADLGAVYSATGAAVWPRTTYCFTSDWWRAFLAVSYTTGLRLSDLLRTLRWSQLGEGMILLQAAKTSKVQALPLLPCARLALNRIYSQRERIFPIRNVPRLRDELKRLCIVAQVQPFLPQSLRRLAANEYESAKEGAGKVLLGHTLGVSGFYLSVPRILREAAAKLELPIAFSVNTTGATG